MKISVVIPTFNRGAAIAATLDSVLNQTHAPLEIIVVDDGSTDGTADFIAAHYGNKVRLIRQQNSGVARARNRGLRESRGEWIAFCDHDDRFHPQKFERFSAFDGEDVGVIVPRWREVGAQIHESPSVAPRNAFSWLFGWHNPIVSMSVPLVKREVMLHIGGFDPRCAPADDWDLWLRLARVTKFAWVDEILVDYSLHDGQQRDDPARMFRAVRRVLGKHPFELARRPLLLWWLLFSGAFVPSIGAYKRFQNGENRAIFDAMRAHPLSILSPQWLSLGARILLRQPTRNNRR
ncbi:MAG: glycosyltransferase [Armatimonadetes bacterium]|nr:glycosyltransferase [Armatimonadota bacterium]